MTLRQRLLLPLLVLGLLIGGYIHFVWAPRSLLEAEQSHLRGVGLQLDAVVEGMIPLLLGNQLDIIHENLAALKRKNEDWAQIRLLNPGGRQLYPLATLADPAGGDLRRIDKEIAHLDMALGKLVVVVDMGPASARLKDRNDQLALLLIAMLTMVTLTLILVVDLAVRRPVTMLAAAARKLAGNDYAAPLPAAGRDEVGDLVRSFASMRDELARRNRELLEEHARLLEEIAERQRAEAEVQQLNRQLEQRVAKRTADLERAVKDLESFSYSVSHDLRAPLRAISGYSHILLEDESEGLSPEGRGHLDRIMKNTIRLAQLIDNILDYSRAGRRELERCTVDMEALAKAVADELASDKARISIGQLPQVQGDPTMLRQILQNLIGNAVKFSSQREQPLVEVGCADEGGETVFYVRDNGAGFDMAYAGKLFGMFQRLHPDSEFPGTGVGLAIVKRLIERHGGRIWAEAEPGRGATFRFTLAATTE